MSHELSTEPAGATPFESLRQFVEYHWLMISVFTKAIEENHGEDAVWLHVRAGSRKAGVYRGGEMRDAATSLTRGRGVRSLLENWYGVEWQLGIHDGDIKVSADPDSVTLRFTATPGLAYLTEALGETRANAVMFEYWAGLFEGVVSEYGSGINYSMGPISSMGWDVTFRGPSVDGGPRWSDSFADETSLLETNRRVTGLLAAFQMYVSESLVEEFDASGEETVRQAAYRFGSERGSVVRERILAQGKELTLANFASKDGLQQRDPGEAVFVFRDRQHISDGAYYLDCTYCPLAEIWKTEGQKGLDLAYLFDASNHRGLFQSYNPETVVRWHSVKSRGDTVCRFRFTIPSMLTEADPTPAEFDLGH